MTLPADPNTQYLFAHLVACEAADAELERDWSDILFVARPADFAALVNEFTAEQHAEDWRNDVLRRFSDEIGPENIIVSDTEVPRNWHKAGWWELQEEYERDTR